MSIPISMTVNGKQVSKSCPANRTLGQFIREDLGLTGTHVGCDTSQCGACTVHLNGDAVKACTCLLYTSPSPRDRTRSRMPSSA